MPRPGGQDAIVLTRTRMMEDSLPEFLSVTMLPGRGMNVLQITAYVPGRGEVSLMASPSVADAAGAMSGVGDDANGQASLAMGGALEAPWAGRIWGTPGPEWAHHDGVARAYASTLPVMAGRWEGATASGGLMLAAGLRTSAGLRQRCRTEGRHRRSSTREILARAGHRRQM